MMIHRMANGSAAVRQTRRLIGSAAKSIRGSLTARLILNSAILNKITSNMPLIGGIAAGLLFIMPHSIFNNLYSLIAVSVLTVLLFLGIRQGHIPKAAFPRLGWCAVLFWAVVAISAVTSPSVTLSLRSLLFHLTAFLMLIIIASTVTRPRALRDFLVPLLGAVSLSGVYGLVQSVTGVEVVQSQVDDGLFADMPGRIYSFYENPNNFAEIIVLTLPFFAAMFFAAKTSTGRRAAFLGAIPPAVALVLTFSRSGWLAFGLAIAVFFFFTYRRVVPFLFLAALIVLPLLPATISERFFSTFAGEDSSILYRARIRDIYQPALRGNWLFGMGLGSDTARDGVIAYNQTAGIRVEEWRVAPHMHHQFLQIWVEMGILGAASFIGLLYAFFRRCVSSLFAPAEKNFIAAAGLAGLAGILLMGFAEYIWFYPRVQLLFWIVIGVTLAALNTFPLAQGGKNQFPDPADQLAVEKNENNGGNEQHDQVDTQVGLEIPEREEPGQG
jgi:O-antigen ligase